MDMPIRIMITLFVALVVGSTIIVFSQQMIERSKEDINRNRPGVDQSELEEQKIIELLMKKPMRQKEVRKILDFPKASYSRYITNLEKKKLIIREGEGKNKILKLILWTAASILIIGSYMYTFQLNAPFCIFPRRGKSRPTLPPQGWGWWPCPQWGKGVRRTERGLTKK